MTRRDYLTIPAAFWAACGGPKRAAVVRLTTVAGDPLPALFNRLGLFSARGLQVYIDEMGSPGKASQALMGGSTDVAFMALDQVLQLAAQGKRLRMFITVRRRNTVGVYGGPGVAPRVRSIADLRGAVIGVSSFGSTTDFILTALLNQNGIKKTDVKVVAIGSAPAQLAALESRKVDAASMGLRSGRAYRRKYPASAVLLDMESDESVQRRLGIALYPLGLIAQSRWLDTNGEAARRIARAMTAGIAWVKAHTFEQMVEALPPEQRSTDSQTDMDWWASTKALAIPDGRMPEGAAEDVRKVLTISIPTVRDVDLSQTWTNEFVEETTR